MTLSKPAARSTAGGVVGMCFVGGSVAVSGRLSTAPLDTLQALRYAIACLLLLSYARMIGARVVMPRGREWAWLIGVTVTGLVIFNVALVHGARHAEPAVIGVAVACVPLVLATLGPLLEGRGPGLRALAGAAVVTAGAVLVEGLGRTDGTGLAWAAVVFGCEAAFTLLAVPVLGRHGPIGVSVHTTWLAAVVFGGLGLIHDGPRAVLRLQPRELVATLYLAVAVTAVAFVLWYGCVRRLGTARAGLLTGVAPIAAALTGFLLGGPVPHLPVWLGIAAVALGLAIGLAPDPKPPEAPHPKPAGAPHPKPAGAQVTITCGGGNPLKWEA